MRDGDELDARWRRALEGLRSHHAGLEPDAGFPARVLARMPAEAADGLGWAAARLLPAGLAVAVVLGWLCLRAGGLPGAAPLAADPVGEVTDWVLGVAGGDS